MLPSEELREIISKRIDIDLSQYKWSKELQNFIFSIKLDEDLEEKVSTLEQVYKLGLNIGHCGLTSRYIAVNFPDTDLYYGTLPAIAGTKNSPSGGHACAVVSNMIVIDPTLMIAMNYIIAQDLGYSANKKIDRRNLNYFSEYDLYSNEFNLYEKDPEGFKKSLLLIKKIK